MYLLKNAIGNIKNSPIRNLLICVIIMVVSLVCFISLALLRVADKAENEAISRSSAIARVVKGDVIDSIDASDSLTYDETKKFCNSNYVYESYISASANLNMRNNEKVTLIGYNSVEAARYFLLVEKLAFAGRQFNPESSLYECLVTNEFSMANGCKVGEKIVLTSEGCNYEFEIVGLYRGSIFNQDNILTTLKTFEEIIDIDEQTTMSSAFVFKNPENIDHFRDYVVSNSTESAKYTAFFSGVKKFKEYFAPIKSTRDIAQISLLLSLFIGGSTLIVISIFNVQERKYEIGALSAIGMSKLKVIIQFVSETAMITLIAVVLGIIIGGPLAVISSRSMLAPKMYTGLTYDLRITSGLQKYNSREIEAGGYQIDVNSDKDLVAIMHTKVSAIASLKAVLSTQIILQVLSVGLFLAVAACLGSLVFVVRFRPLEILNNGR